MAKIIKMGSKKFLLTCLIFFLITSWIFSGWPRIFNFPPKIQGSDLFTALLLTTIFAFAILIIVNPPRPRLCFRRGFYFGKNIGKIAL